MTRTALESSLLKSAGYEVDTKTLEIEFLKGGNVYQYHGVSPETFRSFMEAESQGKFFLTRIKNEFKYTKIETKTTEENKTV